MLYIIQVGHNDASDRYIRNKVKAIEEAGLKATVVNLPEDADTDDVKGAVTACGFKKDCKALMVQLPLPDHIDKYEVLRRIPMSKDIDGLNPILSDYKPLTPCAIMRWLREQNIPVEGKNVVILGRSELVGKPLANMMIDAGATVTVCNSKTDQWWRDSYCFHADILISAVGKTNTIKLRHVQTNTKNRVIIDVGINRDENGKLCGDVHPRVKQILDEESTSICTPVPGGVGKWTVRELVLRLKEMEGH